MRYDRPCVLLIILAVSMYVAFKDTPELSGVKNAGMYRLSFGMVLTRGAAYFIFDILGLFP